MVYQKKKPVPKPCFSRNWAVEIGPDIVFSRVPLFLSFISAKSSFSFHLILPLDPASCCFGSFYGAAEGPPSAFEASSLCSFRENKDDQLEITWLYPSPGFGHIHPCALICLHSPLGQILSTFVPMYVRNNSPSVTGVGPCKMDDITLPSACPSFPSLILLTRDCYSTFDVTMIPLLFFPLIQ